MRIPRNVWVAGWVSFFMDVSSEMVYPLVPLFLSSSLSVGKSVVGMIEGIAEASASLLKLFSGAFVDRFGKNKLLMGLGYGISTGSRPLLALAPGWGMVLASRLTDRIGKGIRTAPRDAIIAAATPPGQLGLAFGLHRSLDTAGAIVGPALALLLLTAWNLDYREVFWYSIIPGVISVLLIARYIDADANKTFIGSNFSWTVGGFDRRIYTFLLAVGLFSLGNSSNAFLILKAEHEGVSPAWISGMYLGYNTVYALAAVPGGILADRYGKRLMIIGGLSLFAGIYAGFALATTRLAIAGLFILYGLYMGLTEGVQRAYLASLTPESRRGTAFGLYHMIVGIAVLPASLMAGFLWDYMGPTAPFWYGASLAMLGSMVLIATSDFRNVTAFVRLRS